jgi:UDP-2,4-diacetamido-2,4,6-trideoxy-beta-L-altropyranose hydrolase
MADPVSARVLVRTVASQEVGAGHLRRCMSLAKRLTRLGAKVEFALPEAPAVFAGWLEDSGHALHVVPAGSDPLADASRCLAAARPDWVVVDDYRLDATWHRQASRLGARVAVIDDLANRPLSADLLVDPNEHEDHRRKYAGVLAGQPLLLGGCRYALLDPVYESAPKYVFHPEVRSIGIFMGGADSANVSRLALEACRRVFDGPVEVAATSAHVHLAELEKAIEAHSPARLSLDQADLSAFFARHDLQIGAGGGATWERCCIGAPTLAMAVAGNQLQVIPELERRGVLAAVPGGQATVASLGTQIQALMADGPRRERMATASRRLVDGQGAWRVALALMTPTMSLRPARSDDCDRVHEWRNDSSVRAQSLDPSPIDLARHRQWFAQTLALDTRKLLIGQIADAAIGVIRFDRLDTTVARVSIFLDPQLHGLRLGTTLLARGEHAVRQAWPDITELTCEVLPANIVSVRMFRAAGYDGAPPRLSKRLH